MNEFIKNYLNYDYLFGVSFPTSYDIYLLYLSFAFIVIPLALRLFFYLKKKRPNIFKSFDKYWFWGYLLFGIAGLFVWFSRDQGLSLFSSRIVLYIWTLGASFYAIILAYWYYFRLPKKIEGYYEEKRKSKYLKK